MIEEQRPGFKFGVTAKLLIPIFIVVVLVIGIQTWTVFESVRQQGQQEAQRDLLALFNDYNSEVVILERAAAALSSSFADRQDIKTLLLANDRAGLLELLGPLFSTLQKSYDIAHLYVHRPNGAVFARVHWPEKYGDDITYRRTAATALETKTTVPGVEIGPSRLGIRSVSPLFEQGEFIGMVEVGLDYDQTFIEYLKAEHGADYRMWITTEAAVPAGLEPEPGAPEPPLPNLLYYASTGDPVFRSQPAVYQRVLESGQPELNFFSVDDQNWAVLLAPLYGYEDRIIGVLEISQSQHTAAAAAVWQAQLANFGIAGLLLFLGLISIAAVVGVLVLRPVKNLTSVAHHQLGGDLTARAENLPDDEFGELGRTLNALTEALEDTVDNQEKIIVNRTLQLHLTLDIARRLSSILDFNRLFQEAVNLVNDRFNLYHTHIYLLDEESEMLVMAAGYGESGREMRQKGHKIPLSAVKSLVARAARSGEVVRVDHVQASKDWLPNPLLPKTRSEVAIPVKLGEKVVGVLDVQSDKIAGFNEEITTTLSVVADHVAVAVRNARRFQETAQALEQAEKIQKRYLQTGWGSYLLQQKQTASRELARPDAPPIDRYLLAEVKQKVQQGETVVLAPAGNGDRGEEAPPGESVVAVPLSVRGQIIGNIRIHDTKTAQPWSAEQIALLEAIGDQMSLALENARLFEETERRASREKMIAEATQQIWASNKLEQVMQTAIRQLGVKLDASRVVIRLGTSEQFTHDEAGED